MAKGTNVARILYKEIIRGDLRKILAQSNDSDSGGGARDFRFGSYEKLRPTIQKMFPYVIQEKRKRNGKLSHIDVFKGEFYWYNDQEQIEHKESFFEPPTDVRPSEGRIVRVHEYGCFDLKRLPKEEGYRVFLLLIQLFDGSVWPYYAGENDLINAKWHPEVAKELLDCLKANRASNRAVIGYRDFTNGGDKYCNGE